MAGIVLYSYWRSTTSVRVRAALNLKGVDYDTRAIDLVAGAQKDPDYAKINPGQGVPSLVLEDGTVLTQSMAILDYLEVAYPTPPLLPKDPVQRALVLAAAHTIALDIHPVNNLRVLAVLKERYGADAAQSRTWMNHWMQEGFTALEAMLPEDMPSFAFGAAPDLADLCITGQCCNARRWGLDMTPFPKIRRIDAACRAVPEIHAAHPEQQPDAQPQI
ncbi:MAG: maleylacetoacetate isomerase [Pseudomonadota bacterium]